MKDIALKTLLFVMSLVFSGPAFGLTLSPSYSLFDLNFGARSLGSNEDFRSSSTGSAPGIELSHRFSSHFSGLLRSSFAQFDRSDILETRSTSLLAALDIYSASHAIVFGVAGLTLHSLAVNAQSWSPQFAATPSTLETFNLTAGMGVAFPVYDGLSASLEALGSQTLAASRGELRGLDAEASQDVSDLWIRSAEIRLALNLEL